MREGRDLANTEKADLSAGLPWSQSSARRCDFLRCDGYKNRTPCAKMQGERAMRFVRSYIRIRRFRVERVRPYYRRR